MLRKVACVMALSFILVSVAGMAQNAAKEKAATTAAEKWLSLIDSGKYAESWKDSTAYFRERVAEHKWEQMVAAVRKPFGKLISRHLRDEAYKTSLPGAPDAQYVVMQFESSFAYKKKAMETVTAVLDKDGKWRAAGYYIR